ncbi:hypothetical protein [Ornithinibacillus caprae]|uniref:hypothetical protein n=1 Tax=Ornithinibacillus caprae TaxID=2678566 RepID=UPI0018C53EC2|nr:hypothetical protein [Ornithinibacillus caprae]
MIFKKVFLSAFTLSMFIISALLIYSATKDIWDKNYDLLRKEILHHDQTAEQVNLTAVTPFEWDTLYSFTPYTPTDHIYDVIGYKWDSISSTVNEGMNQIVFMNGNEVVCYIYGYPSNNNFSININPSDYTDQVATIHAEDNPTFEISKEDGIVYLNQID